MAQSILGSVTLGYAPIWSRMRRCVGVRLFVDTNGSGAVDAHRFLDAITDMWPKAAPTLLLCVESPDLLNGLLSQSPRHGIWIDIADSRLSDAMFARRVQQAHQRGLPLVWSGDAGQVPAPEVAGWFDKSLRTLTVAQALAALRVSVLQQREKGISPTLAANSPVVAGCIYQGLASQALVEHALDDQKVWGVEAWPTDEILHGYRFRQVQPSKRLMRILLKAIENDESLDTLENHMGNEPLLTYRFLRYANSAHLGSHSEVSSVRQGLMLMGYSKLRTWLMDQMPHASEDANLDPIRTAMVLRAHIMERLADVSIEGELRREVFLCGIFSQLDLLLDEALDGAILRLPLPGRIASAIVGKSGPYAPWLEVAATLESGNTRMIQTVCKAHDMPIETVNRALLRALAAI